MVVVNGYVAGLAVGNPAGGVHKGIPDGWAFPILIPGAFHLVRGGSAAPYEIFRKGYEFIHVLLQQKEWVPGYFLGYIGLGYPKMPVRASEGTINDGFNLGVQSDCYLLWRNDEKFTIARPLPAYHALFYRGGDQFYPLSSSITAHRVARLD